MVRQLSIYSLLVFLYISNSICSAQNKVESITKLSETVNSEAEEILPLLSPSGDSLFFARVFHDSNLGGKYSGSDIWVSLFDETKNWLPSSNQINRWNDKQNNFVVGINSEESIIYQNNPKNPEKGIQFVKKLNGEWTRPENISLPGIPNSGYQGLYVSPDYSIILISMKSENGSGQEDLYVFTKNNNGDWNDPTNLGSTINTSESEISPFLSADKKTLFFSSKGHGGYGGMDIFKSERLYDSWNVWSRPQNLGNQINSSAFDGYYSEYGDSIAFFSSNRDSQLADIYEVTINKTKPKGIEQLISNNANYPVLDNSKIFGFKIDSLIYFETNKGIISPKSSELLFYVANEISRRREINILLVGDDSTPTLSNLRMSNASIYLQNNGISPRRIKTELKSDLIQTPNNKILLYFYKSINSKE